jgi:hypothetical protein
MICRVIGLERRKDRLESVSEEMKKIGFEWEFFPSKEVSEDNFMREASFNFMDVLKNADDDILVCESDVTFLHQAREIFNRTFSQLPEDWDLLYLGGNIHESAERVSENLFRIRKGVHCNHAILYSKKGKEIFLKNYNPLTDEIIQIDHWLYMKGQGLMNCYICSPMIAYQIPGYSDSSNKLIDYYIEMRSNELKYLA